MKTVRVQNPGPAALWVVNGRKKTMRKARRKGGRRKASATVRRRATHQTRSHNPPARRVRHRPRRRHNPGLFARRRVRRYTPRRRNPAGSGLLAKGLVLALAGAGIQFVVSFVPPIGGVSAPADALRTLGIAFLASIGMKRTGFLSRYGDDVFLAGATLAGGKIISSLLVPWALRLFPQRAPAAPRMPQGEEAAAMAGLATLYPGQQLFSRYRPGMQGLATWYPGQQPYAQWYTAAGGVPMA